MLSFAFAIVLPGYRHHVSETCITTNNFLGDARDTTVAWNKINRTENI